MKYFVCAANYTTDDLRTGAKLWTAAADDSKSQLELPEEQKKALNTYLQAYLLFLHAAGHHVLFSLPRFDGGNRTRQSDDWYSKLDPPSGGGNTTQAIDFSMIATERLRLPEVHGVSIELLNRFMLNLWIKATMTIAASPEGEQPTNCDSISLSEYRSGWLSSYQGAPTSGLKWTAKFNPPRVEAMCNDELILHFIIDEVVFHEDESKDAS